jgi:tetratricopeptide (TPR) repeat protein
MISALNNKGEALNNQGKYQEAIEYFDRVLAIDPNDRDESYSKELTERAALLLLLVKRRNAYLILPDMYVSLYMGLPQPS